MRAIFRDLLDRTRFRRLYFVILICTIPNFIFFRVELYFVMMVFAVLISQSLLGADSRARITTFWMSVILFVPLRLELGGFGGIKYFLNLDHFKLAAIFLLVPVASALLTHKSPPRSSTWALDLAVLAYPIFVIASAVTSVSLTASVRSLVVMGLDIVLPYFVLTRGIRSWPDLRHLLVHLLGACLFAAAVGLLEFAIQRNIYADIQWAFGITWSLTHTLLRGDLIRVQAMTPQPIIYAAQLMMTLGLWWTAGASASRPAAFSRLVDLGIICALAFTFSRGPWLGTILFAVTVLALSRVRASLVAFGLIVIVVVGICIKVAGLDTAVLTMFKHIFGGTQEESGSIEYRSQLLDSTIALLKQSPWTGVPNYTAQMQDLVQGEGIIDLVNAYVGVALNSGLIGLTMYLAPFLISLFMLFRSLERPLAHLTSEEIRYRRVAVALLVGFLFTIFTTSSWERLPFLLLFCIATPAILVGSPRRLTPQSQSTGEERTFAPNVHAT